MTSETPRERGDEPARLVIVDDQEIVRAGLRGMLASEPSVEVVGEASNGRDALALCRRILPDLVLMDVRMPDLDGLAATRALKEECPSISVIIVTMHENPDYLFEALKAGAAGYVLKDATRRELVSAIQQVLGGDTMLNADLATRLLRRLADESPQERKSAAVALTRRERQVLRLLAQGQTNREIAGNLVITAGTAKQHVERILGKLGVSDRTQAAVRAVELGLLDSSDDD
jgi:DNA-binding NarL/FixJ family response regulator